MYEPTLAVAVLNWNGKALLERFMPSVIAHSQEATVYVIDNASSDGSSALLAEKYPSVQCLSLAKNGGYAGGYNQGLKLIKEDLVVLLNSDVEVSPNWLSPLLKRFTADERLGALQPKILDLKNPDQFEYAGAAGGFVDYLGYPFCRGRIFTQLEKDSGQYNQYRQVFWATGACLVVRQSAYRKAGGLNEMLFAHMEEIDLCWRMQIKGYKIAVEPASTVFHLGGGTLKPSPEKTYLNFRNSLFILFLNLPQGEALLKILARLFLDGLAGLKFLISRQPKHMWAILRAHFSFYQNFNKLFAQKIKLQQLPLSSLNGVYQGSIVLDFYAKGKKRFSQLKKIH